MKRVDEQNIVIGKKLKEYRENRGYTQEDVAKEIDTSIKENYLKKEENPKET